MKIKFEDALLVEHLGIRIELETDTEGNATETFQLIVGNQAITGIPTKEVTLLIHSLTTSRARMDQMELPTDVTRPEKPE